MSAELFDFVETLAPGVRGYTVDLGARGLYVPLIEAVTPGNGDVGRYLDSLPRDRRVVVPNVLSGRLEGMLQRRGFALVSEWAEEMGEYVPCWERKAPDDFVGLGTGEGARAPSGTDVSPVSRRQRPSSPGVAGG